MGTQDVPRLELLSGPATDDPDRLVHGDSSLWLPAEGHVQADSDISPVADFGRLRDRHRDLLVSTLRRPGYLRLHRHRACGNEEPPRKKARGKAVWHMAYKSDSAGYRRVAAFPRGGCTIPRPARARPDAVDLRIKLCEDAGKPGRRVLAATAGKTPGFCALCSRNRNMDGLGAQRRGHRRSKDRLGLGHG